MKTKLTISLFSLFALSVATAQNSAGVYEYFNSKIDEAVSAAADVDGEEADESNPVYAKLFSTPVLYESVVDGAFAGKDDAESDVKAMDAEREASYVEDDAAFEESGFAIEEIEDNDDLAADDGEEF